MPVTVPDRNATLALWRRAEAEVYPAVMVNAALYQDYIRVIRAVVDALHDVETEDDLLVAYAEYPGVADAAAGRLGVAMGRVMDLGRARDAAFCQRHRDIQRARGRAIAQERLEEARRTGRAWVVLFEDFTPLGSHRLEMHVRTGRAIHASTTVDVDAARPTYELEAVRLLPETGAWVLDAPPLVPSRRYERKDEWLAQIDKLRAFLEREE